MAELTASPAAMERTQPRFFFWAGVACVGIAFGGFTPTYFIPLTNDTLRDVSLAVHIHGFLFFGWTLLFVLQVTLIGRSNRSMHRNLGMLGISWATAMVIFGLLVNLFSNAKRFAAGDEQIAYNFVLSGGGAMIAFGVLFALAVANVHRPAWHKRFMLIATTAILAAATARLWLPVFDFQAVPLWLSRVTQDLPIVALFVYDWRTLGKPHFVTTVFGGGLIALHVIHIPLASTEAFQWLARLWLSIAG